jgi:hypothetical protein
MSRNCTPISITELKSKIDEVALGSNTGQHGSRSSIR